MTRVRVSTTVDADLIAQARAVCGGSDASLVEAALTTYLREHRRAEIDRAYEKAYAEQPLNTPDAWGDLASFHEAMDRT